MKKVVLSLASCKVLSEDFCPVREVQEQSTQKAMDMPKLILFI